MEGGAFQEEEFVAFCKKVVPFCHITSHIEGRPNDDLLSRIGGGYFPYITAMDADGKVLAVLDPKQGRTVATFEGLLQSAGDFVELKKKAEAGDKAAQYDYFVKAARLKHFTLEEARKKAAELKDLGDDQKKEVDGILLGIEVDEIAAPLMRGISDPAKSKEARIQAGRKFLEMEKAGRVPEEDNRFQVFSVCILECAEEAKDVATFERILDAIEKRYGKNAQRFLDQKREVLRKMKEEKEQKEEKE